MKRCLLALAILLLAMPSSALAKRPSNDLKQFQALYFKLGRVIQQGDGSIDSVDHLVTCHTLAGTCQNSSYNFAMAPTTSEDVGNWQLHFTSNIDGEISDTIINKGHAWTRSNMVSQLYSPDCFTPFQLEDSFESFAFVTQISLPLWTSVFKNMDDIATFDYPVHLRIKRSPGRIHYFWNYFDSSVLKDGKMTLAQKTVGSYHLVVDGHYAPTAMHARVHTISDDPESGHQDDTVVGHSIVKLSKVAPNLTLAAPVCES